MVSCVVVIITMVVPEKLTSLKAEQLRDECEERELASEGLARDQMIQEIIRYESTGTDADLNELSKLEYKGFDRLLQLKRLEMEQQHQKLELEQRRMEHEFRMKQLEVQGNPREGAVDSRSPKIPHFSEGDDVEIYLGTFERLATANKWKPRHLGSKISSTFDR